MRTGLGDLLRWVAPLMSLQASSLREEGPLALFCPRPVNAHSPRAPMHRDRQREGRDSGQLPWPSESGCGPCRESQAPRLGGGGLDGGGRTLERAGHRAGFSRGARAGAGLEAWTGFSWTRRRAGSEGNGQRVEWGTARVGGRRGASGGGHGGSWGARGGRALLGGLGRCDLCRRRTGRVPVPPQTPGTQGLFRGTRDLRQGASDATAQRPGGFLGEAGTRNGSRVKGGGGEAEV